MPPRECDNDDCDYETFVDGDGNPRTKWVHVAGCTPAWGPQAGERAYREARQ